MTGPDGAFCAACGTRLSAGAKFCHRCGAEAGASVPARGGTGGVLPWAVAALALVALVALLAGQFYGRHAPERAADAVPPSSGRAPDISSMSPEERASRLFDRVMRYAGEGKTDSARFFAPMALGALEALSPLSLPHRYQLGLLGLATGDPVLAAAEADTILRAKPTYLLGLMLAGWTAEARGDSAAMRGFYKRLVAAEPAERKLALPEYTEYDTDIRTAIIAAQSKKP